MGKEQDPGQLASTGVPGPLGRGSQVRLIRATKAYWCPQDGGTKDLWFHQESGTGYVSIRSALAFCEMLHSCSVGRTYTSSLLMS